VIDEVRGEVCTTEGYYLGECCRWDHVRQELSWVNIAPGSGQMFRASVVGSEITIHRRYDFEGSPTAFAPLAQVGDGWIVAMGQSLYLMDAEGGVQMVASPEERHADTVRTNDGIADPWGRFWIGSMAYDFAPGAASLYRFGREGLRTIFEDVTISNGIGWSPDARTMYYIDSGPGTIQAFEVDESGEISSPRIFAHLDVDREGAPDGMCVDAEGGVWVAIWGGYEVRHYSPEGVLLGRVTLDTAQPSSCALGGPDGTTLYITTAQENMTVEQLEAEPHAGRLFCAEVGVRGLPLNAFDASRLPASRS
jgi:sugar lactone lactonase YvrE